MHDNKYSYPNVARIVVLGASGVGKTAIIVRCLTKRFLPEYVTGYDSSHMFTTSIDSKTVKLELVDSSKELASLASLADAFVFVYSVTNRSSLVKLRRYAEIIARETSTKVPIVIVGNKRDMEHSRTVSTAEGIKMARELNASLFSEVSVAEDIERVQQIFTETYRRVARRQRKLSNGNKSMQKYTPRSLITNMMMKLKPFQREKDAESMRRFESQLRMAMSAVAL